MKKYACLLLNVLLLCGLMSGCHSSGGDASLPTDGITTAPTQPAGPVTRFLVAEECIYYSDGELCSKKSYTYDEKGRLLSFCCENYLSDKVDSYSYTYEYNERGLLETETHCFWEGRKTVRSFEYTYNSDGSVASYQCTVRDYMPNESAAFGQHFEAEYEFTYDSAGNLTQYISRVGSAKVETKYSFVYDEQGRLVEEKEHHETYDNSFIVEYTDRGWLKSAHGGFVQIDYAYDADGNLIHEDHLLDYSLRYAYTDGVLSEIVYETQLNYGDTMERTYHLNPDGTIKEMVMANGRRKTYQYTSVTLDVLEEPDIVRYWSLVNDKLTRADFVDNIVQYFLPSADPFQIA